MVSTDVIDARLARLARFPFRAKFHLRPVEIEYLATHGMPTVRAHARDLIARRVAPANPAKDGKQTPWGGHPVFRAQHATATCCRGCLEKNHGIRRGHDLTEAELDYVVDVICRFIEKDLRDTLPTATGAVRADSRAADPAIPGASSIAESTEPSLREGKTHQPPLFDG